MSEASEADPVGAFMPGPRLLLPPTASGPLDGVVCAVKDVFDIDGRVSGYGNPDWAATHAPASRHASAVGHVLGHGAQVVGMTITDELAFSLSGANHHFGAPRNATAPGRLTGGSSCGSAAAVAARLCDVALGTDTAGSVRVPASFCGIFGFRPTHGAVSSDGVRRLAPSFDTVGWFARDPRLLVAMGDALLPPDGIRLDASAALWDPGAWELLDEPQAADVRAVVEGSLPAARFLDRRLADDGFGPWFQAFRTLQFAEVWEELGPWVSDVRPTLGPGVSDRVEAARRITAPEVEAAQATRDQICALVAAVWKEAGVIVVPTVPGAAPLRTSSIETLERYRGIAMGLTSLAGHTGCPQLSLPVLRMSGAPLGLSLIGPRGSDRQLLALGSELAGAIAAIPEPPSPVHAWWRRDGTG
ncbi:amidase [Methylobacterium sp. C1]|uniref:amidase n=1 Tax=Methylobacterium sp. C1 TaxID=1479019 RepID=UPI001331BA4E|nr:amidase [Methylobacterium sp. C1]